MFDDFFDDDLSWEEIERVGSFVDYMSNQEDEDEKQRQKLEDEPDFDDPLDEDYEDDPDDERFIP
jgi:hypothetical protein